MSAPSKGTTISTKEPLVEYWCLGNGKTCMRRGVLEPKPEALWATPHVFSDLGQVIKIAFQLLLFFIYNIKM